jgi:hypothetical protein
MVVKKTCSALRPCRGGLGALASETAVMTGDASTRVWRGHALSRCWIRDGHLSDASRETEITGSRGADSVRAKMLGGRRDNPTAYEPMTMRTAVGIIG